MDRYKISEKLSSYIGFDIKLIINERNDYATVFGGAIRDIIANMKINDIDILCLPKSSVSVEKTLKEQGYIWNEDICMKMVYSMYSNIHCIQEPHTWIKNDKVIQVIRPSIRNEYNPIGYDFDRLLAQVDISCCGVNYSFKGLNESVEDAIKHCEHKIFYGMKSNEMYHRDRFIQRVCKLEERGWKFSEYMSKDELKKIENIIIREKKITRILNGK